MSAIGNIGAHTHAHAAQGAQRPPPRAEKDHDGDKIGGAPPNGHGKPKDTKHTLNIEA